MRYFAPVNLLIEATFGGNRRSLLPGTVSAQPLLEPMVYICFVFWAHLFFHGLQPSNGRSPIYVLTLIMIASVIERELHG